jgi:hypothetical protein
MADKTENKPLLVASPRPPAERPEETTPLEADGQKAFDPYRYQTHEVQLEDRIKWLNADLPSIGALEDTVPPNAARSAPMSPPPSTTEPQRESLETQTFATPAHVIDAPVPAAARPTSPSLRRVKRDAAELTIMQRAERRRRRATIAGFVVLFLVLAVGVFALTRQNKNVSPNSTVATAVETSEPAVVERPKSELPSAIERTSAPDAPSATAPLAPASQSPHSRHAPSPDGVPSGVPASGSHKIAPPQRRVEDVKPLVPPPSPASTKPVVPPPPSEPAAPGGVFNTTPFHPPAD